MRRLHRFLATPEGVIFLTLLMIFASWALLGMQAGVKFTLIVAAVGIVDLIFGIEDTTFSEDVNRVYHKARWRFWLWAATMAALIVLGLGAHFTGV